MQVEGIGGSTKAYWPTDWTASEYRQSGARRDDAGRTPAEVTAVSTVAATAQVQVPRQMTVQAVDKAEDDTASDIPPFGGLPSTRSVLSALTPADRAAIAGATGFH